MSHTVFTNQIYATLDLNTKLLFFFFFPLKTHPLNTPLCEDDGRRAQAQRAPAGWASP